MLRLRSRILPLLPAASSPLHSRTHPRPCCLLSTSPVPFSLEAYLVAACGLAPAEAGEVSKKAFRELARASRNEDISRSRLFSASNPDAVVTLLSGAGLSHADIAAVVSADPLLLRASVKIISPRLLAPRDLAGLSGSQIARFLRVPSHSLHRRRDILPKLEFFISFYGSFEKFLVAVKRSMLTFSLEHLRESLLRAQQLGVPPTSRMFRHAVAVTASRSKDKVAAKLEFYKRTLGVSESEVSIALSKMPGILGFSDEILARRIEFLVNEAAMEPRDIVQRPVLFTLSLEKRLVPRHYVMKVLQENGLRNRNTSFYSLATLGEETFKSKFIDCHMDSVPGLADSYAAARAGIVPSGV